MSFVEDETMRENVGRTFGEYRITFRSEHEQVVAYLFAEQGWLVAHISLPSTLQPEDVTDSYLGELYRYAEQEGFRDKFRIIDGE